MEFVYGTVMLLAAIVLLGVAKFAVARVETSSWVRKFAATETLALLITIMSAFGVAFLCAGIASNQDGLGFTELAAALGVIALSIVGVIRVFRHKQARPVRAPAGVPTTQATI